MISALVGLTQGTYSFRGGISPLEDYEIDAVMQVPEPGTAALLLVGAALMLLGRRRRR